MAPLASRGHLILPHAGLAPGIYESLWSWGRNQQGPPIQTPLGEERLEELARLCTEGLRTHRCHHSPKMPAVQLLLACLVGGVGARTAQFRPTTRSGRCQHTFSVLRPPVSPAAPDRASTQPPSRSCRETTAAALSPPRPAPSSLEAPCTARPAASLLGPWRPSRLQSELEARRERCRTTGNPNPERWSQPTATTRDKSLEEEKRQLQAENEDWARRLESSCRR